MDEVGYTIHTDCPLEEPCTSFDAFDLHEDLLRGVYKYGFKQPTIVQKYATKSILSGRNVTIISAPGEFPKKIILLLAFHPP